MFDPECDGNSHFSDLKYTCNLSNLGNSAIFFRPNQGTLPNVSRNNNSKSFQMVFDSETGMSYLKQFLDKYLLNYDQKM